MAPFRLGAQDARLAAVLTLIRTGFAEHEGRIDPPSSMHRMTPDTLRDTARVAEVWGIGDPVQGCVILSPRPECLYLGKLAVDPQRRGTGVTRRLMELAAVRARDLGYARIDLEVRIELTENHAIFGHYGFVRIGETAHPGYDRPTSIHMRWDLSQTGAERAGVAPV